jgi:hypothetical protein
MIAPQSSTATYLRIRTAPVSRSTSTTAAWAPLEYVDWVA